MPTDLAEALAVVRALVLDDATLVRAVASGRRRGGTPAWRRAELRWVDLKAGRLLQLAAYDATQAHTSNHDPAAAPGVLDAVLAEPFGSWHVDTTTETVQLRVTKKGAAMLHRAPRPDGTYRTPARAHDRLKTRMLPLDDPALLALGLADAQGRVKASREAKARQVEELLRALSPALDGLLAHARMPTADDPLRVADLGCGNGYLTFAVHRWLTDVRGLPARVVGVDVKEQSWRHNTDLARRLGVAGDVTFKVGSIDGVVLDPGPEIVLALHACDTATDDALARAVRWGSAVVLAAPCCHHDLAAQLRHVDVPSPYALLTRHGILRERLADTLTDGIRAAILRREGYRVDVIEFVESRHTPRNTLLRAVRTGIRPGHAADEVEALLGEWGLHPALKERLSRR